MVRILHAGGGIFGAERRLLFHEGATGIVRTLGGAQIDEMAPRVVLGPDGEELGRLHVRKKGMAGRAFGVAWSLLGRGVGSGRTHEADLVDATGSPVLQLQVSFGLLHLKDGAGAPIAEVQNVSRVNGNRLEVDFREPRKRRFDLSKGGPIIARLDGEPVELFATEPRFTWQIQNSDGALVATIDHAERKNRLELHRDLDPSLRATVIGFTAALFDRFWLQVPSDSGGGV